MANTSSSNSSSSRRSISKTTADITTNLANFLPTGTFLAFQSVAPLFTNNGDCGNVEKIVTGVLIVLFCFITFMITYTDSITTSTGKHYYGLVTSNGLYNPQFKGSNIAHVTGSFYKGEGKRYYANVFDFINGTLGVWVLAALVLLTPPITTCYYPRIPATIIKAVPILVGIVASLYFSFAPPPRKSVGFSVAGLVTEPVADHEDAPPAGTPRPTGTNANARAKESAKEPASDSPLTPAGKATSGAADASPARPPV